MNPAEMVADWAWSLPLIVLNVIIHVLGLGIINHWVVSTLSGSVERRRSVSLFVVVMGITVALVTILLGIEATAWAAAYRLLGTLPDNRSAMLYSLNAMTSYGHTTLYLEAPWQLMGALEAVNGMLLFGLTTAFLVAVIQQVWLVGTGGGQRHH